MTTIALVVALSMPLQAGKAQESGWKELQSKEGAFSVLMPDTPIEHEQSHRQPDRPDPIQDVRRRPRGLGLHRRL